MSEAEQASVPCLIPVQLTVTPGEVSRGFMTRLGPSTATVSADPVPPEGTRIQLSFRRPTDNQEVTLDGTVGQMLTEGGLWRGRAAMLVLFDASVSGEKVIPGSWNLLGEGFGERVAQRGVGRGGILGS